MVEPTTDTNRSGLSRPARNALMVLAWLIAGFSGCGLVPKSRVEDCHRVSQTLRVENDRLKDLTLELRTQNQDLSQRAVDDARQIAAKNEANERLVKSVQAYQAERDKLAEAFLSLEQKVRMAVSPHPAARPRALKAFVDAHPDWSFDAARMTLSAPTSRLFDRGTAALTPDADTALQSLAAEFQGNDAEALSLEVIGPSAEAPVALAVFSPSGDGQVNSASSRFLSIARAAKVRDRLAAVSGLDPSHVRLAPPEQPSTASLPDGSDRRIEIRINVSALKPERPEFARPSEPSAAGLDSAPVPGR